MLNGQTIWTEDFTYPNGTIQGSGVPPKWTRDVSNCSLGAGYMEVRSQSLRGCYLEGEAVITTETIDISAYSDLSITFNLWASEDTESNAYFKSYYVLDGGAETMFETNGWVNGDDGWSGIVSQTGLNGNSLTIIFRIYNENEEAIYSVDNIEVNGNLSLVGDICSNAFVISEVTDLTFNTTTFSASGEHPGCGGINNPVDIWYAYTATYTGTGSFDLCGSGFDTRLAIWDACGGSVLACNDNDGPACSSTASSIEIPVIAGTTYYVQVGGNNSATGSGDLTIFVTEVNSWTGAINGDWSNPGNWSNSTVPQLITDITILGYTPNFPIIDNEVVCNNLLINDGGELTIVSGGVLKVYEDFSNGSGSSGEFRMIDGICTILGNYYSEIGAETNIEGGVWSFTNWNRNASTVWSKGDIKLSGGIINCAGSIVWSNYNVSGLIDGPVTVNIGGSFRNSSDDWTITDGEFNMLGTYETVSKDYDGIFYILASSFGAGNYVATPRLNIRTPENIVYSTSSEGDVTGVWVLDDIRVDSGFLSTSGITGSKDAGINDHVIVEGNVIIGPKGKMTANVSGSFHVYGDVQLQADEDNMASFIDNGNVIVDGTSQVQQYLSSERWHLVTPAVTGATISTYMNIYLKEYNEPDNTWTYLFQPTTLPMNTTQGYAAWASDALTGSTTVTYDGVLNTGDYYMPSFSYTLTSPTTGWNLVGNPYPSTIQWNATWPKTDLSEWACIHRNGNDGCYNAITGAEWPKPGSLPNGNLGPTQGFWVRATSDLASMSIENSQRIHNNQPLYKESFIEIEQSIRLMIEGNDDFDVVLIQFAKGATAGFDDSFDLEKRWGYYESPNMYTIHEDETLYSVDVRQQIEAELVIPIGFETGLPGKFVVEATQFDGLTGEHQVILEDIKEEVYTYLEKNTKYEFSGDPQDDNHRFNLHFKNLGINIQDELTNIQDELTEPAHIYSFENDVYVVSADKQIEEVVIFDIMGHEVTCENGNNRNVLKIPLNTETGLYMIRARTSIGTMTKKVYIK